MSVATLERSIAALKKHAFSDILEDRIRADRKLSRPFEAASSYVPPGPARGAFRHREMIDSLSNELIADFGITDDPVSAPVAP